MREYLPPAPLAPFVECFWSRSAPGPGDPEAPHHVLPDGCLDIIFSPRGAVVVGTMTRPLLVPSRAASTLLGVRFLPGMATAFLQVPAAAFTDDQAPLEVVSMAARWPTAWAPRSIRRRPSRGWCGR